MGDDTRHDGTEECSAAGEQSAERKKKPERRRRRRCTCGVRVAEESGLEENKIFVPNAPLERKHCRDFLPVKMLRKCLTSCLAPPSLAPPPLGDTQLLGVSRPVSHLTGF